MRTDELIKKDLIDQLAWDDRVDASSIRITVDDGKVTLSGDVPSFSARQAASTTSWMVSGVLAVDNQLSLSYNDPKRLPSDTEIRESIVNSLRWNPDLRSFNIGVTVNDGWVTLEGTTDAYWKKLNAESEAFSVRGVINVTNKIAIVPTEEIGDEIIAQDVVDAIDRNVSVRANDVDVTVEDGRVILQGAVPSYDARLAAHNSALYTTGVTDVEDRLLVREPQPTLA